MNKKASALFGNRMGAAAAALSVVGLLSSAVSFVGAQEPADSPSGQSSQQQSDAPSRPEGSQPQSDAAAQPAGSQPQSDAAAQPAGSQPQSDAAAQPAGSQPQAGGTDSAGQAQQTEPLKGAVQKVELTLDDIRTLNLDVKHLITASSHLHDEVTMRQISIEQEPEVVGMGTVIMIPVGFQQVGPVLPAKKKRVDLAMSQLRPLIQMFKTDLDEFMSGQKELALPDDVRQELQPYFKDWISEVNEASEQLAKLEPLVTGPPYDQETIAGIAADINQDAHNMLKTLKKVYDIVRKEGKKMKRA